MLTKQKPAAAPTPIRSGRHQRKRPQLGIIVSQETKDRIEQMARDNSRSMGQMVEHLIQEALHTRRLLADVHSSIRRGGNRDAGDRDRAVSSSVDAHRYRPGRRGVGAPGHQAANHDHEKAVRGHLTRRGKRSWRLKYDLAGDGEAGRPATSPCTAPARRRRRRPPRSSPASPAAPTSIPQARPWPPSSSAGSRLGRRQRLEQDLDAVRAAPAQLSRRPRRPRAAAEIARR